LILDMEIFTFSGSHYEVGLAIGKAFSNQIRKSLSENVALQERFLPFHHTAEGKAKYEELLRLHALRYPDFLSEIEGTAKGAGISFEELLVANLGDIYDHYAPKLDASGCSTCSLATSDCAMLGHSEDNSTIYKDQMYLARIEITGKPALTALCYPGYLPGRAFGFNDQGICMCANSMGPKDVVAGLGRHFLTRSLFEARSLDEAVQLATASGRASGVNVTIGSAKERRIVDLEISPQDHNVLEIRGSYFHANHYVRLAQTDQSISPSSRSRQMRGEALLKQGVVRDKKSILSILRDQSERDYPILRDGKPPDTKSITLCIGFFDLCGQTLTIYPGAPGIEDGFDPLMEIPFKR
jgi:predicted choloylglycine hydrolase